MGAGDFRRVPAAPPSGASYRVFSRTQLLDRVWGSDLEVELRTVDATIRRLRRALNVGKEADLLRTVRAEGYALDHKFAGVAEEGVPA